MSEVQQYLESLTKKGEKALVPFTVAGYPSVDESVRLGLDILEAGGDVLELGLPYSDPMADGPVIETASHQAVNNGVRTKDVLKIVEGIKKKTSKPLVLLSYYNPILKYGLRPFIQDFVNAGLSGLVIPDLPLEEREEIYSEVKGRLSLIPLISPVTGEGRLGVILKRSDGFVYCISRQGTTGARDTLSQQGEELIERASRHTNLPLLLGFGISTPEQAQLAAKYASGVIVGSAVVKKITDNPKEVPHFVSELKDGLRPQSPPAVQET